MIADVCNRPGRYDDNDDEDDDDDDACTVFVVTALEPKQYRSFSQKSIF